ncbi:MAG: helix-turn-helix domain-containing protein [Candidatus Margulisbacteria bacterium]|jgi:predicted transcriptional regulator|nr:helix-turn-helix domain-containing protein [Candidatus Margulisiibacteriota bacterium]
MSLAKDFAKIRKTAGLTQVELSRRSGVGLRFIRNLEQGRLNFRYDKLKQLLDFFGRRLEIV